MSPLPFFIKYGLFTLITILFWYGIGNLLSRLVGRKTNFSFAETFLHLTVGWYTSTMIYGALVTSGKTILLLSLIPILLVFFLAKKELPILKLPLATKKSKLTIWLGVFLVFLAIVAVNVFKYWQQDYGIVFNPNSDVNYYGHLSEMIRITGNESKDVARSLLDSANYKGATPYHYFDVHLGGLLSRIFNIPPSLAYSNVGGVATSMVILTGLLAVIEKYKDVNFLHIAIGVAMLCAHGITFSFYGEIPLLKRIIDGVLDTPIYAWIGMLRTNMSIPILILTFLLLGKKTINAALAVFLLSVFMHIGFAPGVLAGASILVFYLLVFKKNRSLLPSILGILLSTIGVVLFYKILSPELKAGNVPIMNIGSAEFIKEYLQYVAKYFLQPVVLFIPFIILAFGKIKQLKKSEVIVNWFVLLTGSLLVALLFGSLFYKNFDGIQIYTNIAREMLLVTTFLGLVYFLFKSPGKLKLAALLIYGVFLFKSIQSQVIYLNRNDINHKNKLHVGYEFVTEIDKELNQSSVERPIIIGSLSDAFTRYPMQGNILTNLEPSSAIFFLDFDKTYENPPSLHKINFEALRENSIFITFCNNQKTAGTFQNYKQSKIDFIDQFNIKYLMIAPKTNIDPLIKNRIIKLITDDVSGYQLAIL